MLKKSVENAPVVASDYVQESKINVTKCQDTQIGNRYYYNVEKINVVCSDAEKEITLDPALLTNNISSPLKTDNSSKVIVINNQKFQIQRRYVLAVAAVLVLITVTVTLAVILTTASSGNNNDDGLLTIISRKDWFAENSTMKIDKLQISPAPYVIIAHTVTQECNTTQDCKDLVKSIQALHISLGFGDIGYNFLVGGDGDAYVGLGWDLWGAHTLGYNQKSIGLAFIGNFMDKLPPKQQLRAAELLLEVGLTKKKITPNYIVYGQKQVRATDSPGTKLMDYIQKTWPHWRSANASSTS